MKRRLAWLLALSLTFASLPAVGAGAAENTVAGTEVVTEMTQEETTGDAASEQTEVVESTEEDKEEAAAAGTSDQGTTEKEEADPEETVENSEEENEEGITEEDAAAGATDTEFAAEVEPVEDTVEKDAKEATKKVGWVADSGKWYYYSSSGQLMTGWQNIGGKWYYLSRWEDGAMLTGIHKLDGKLYFFDTSGSLASNWRHIDGKWHYVNSSGVVLTGWQKIGGKWYYLSRWENGAMLTGTQVPDGETYLFDSSGAMVTGWKKIDGKWYYANSSGVVQTGWQKIDGKWYYLSRWDNGAMLTGFQTLDGQEYYFKPGWGYMVTGWQVINGRYHLFNSSGHHLLGWQKDGGKWYYLAKSDGYYDYSGREASDTWYEKGAMLQNWQILDGYTYYFVVGSGAMVSTPTKLSGLVYFFWSNGHFDDTKGWKRNGYWYYVGDGGYCLTNQYVDGYWLDANGRWGKAMDLKAQNYSSNTGYLILVDKTTYTVGIYQGRKGAWTQIKEWPCTHGGSKTPNGEWTIDWHQTNRSEKYGWAEFKGSSACYACHISAGNYFHSILYEKLWQGSSDGPGTAYWNLNPANATVIDPDMYWNGSNGCIRLQTENAKWVWYNIPKGTKVVVYNS